MEATIVCNKDPSLQGYPLEISENIDIKYCCGICRLILRQPLQSFCGHRFCKVCLENFVREKDENDLVCAKCREEENTEGGRLSLDQTFPDNAIKREFFQLNVKCPFPSCNWSGSFKDFEPHFNSCEFFCVKCELCSKMVSRQECTSHWPCRSSQCPFGCEQQIEPADLDQHVKDSFHVHLEIVQQNLKKLDDAVGRETISASNERSISDRIYFIDRSIQQLGEQSRRILTTREDQSASAIMSQELRRDDRVSASLTWHDLNRTLNINTEKMIIVEGIITIFSRELEKLSAMEDEIGRQGRLDKDFLETIDRKAQQVERLMTLKEASITDIELRITGAEQASFDGTLTWRIPDFQRRRQDAIAGRTTSLYSPSFYTSKIGYKMCCRIYLNGDGMGKGTHVSLFFVIMRGQFDALLSWPFHQKVTMTVVDQNNRESATDAFRPDPTSSSFKRPQSEMNIASGCPLFMPLTLLDSPSHAFVKDNVAFVKIVVDCDDLG